MADLFIVRLRLRATLWFVGVAFAGALLGTWDAWSQLGPGGEGEPRFYLFATVAGALVLAWAGVLVVFLNIEKLMRPNLWQDSRLARVQWWAVGTVLLLLLIIAGGVVLHRLSLKTADEFTLLRKNQFPALCDYIGKNPEALVRRDKKSGRTLLETALESGNAEVVDMLLLLGASTNGINGWVAPMLGNLPMVKTLLRHGADPDAPDAANRVPVYYAARTGNTNALALLLDVGADVDVRSASSRTPLQLAIMENDLAAARMLVECGADPNKIDRNGDTALHKAVRRRNAKAVRYLLENGADPCIFNFEGMAPIHIAALNGRNDLVEIFLEKPGQVSLVSKANRTAFDYALRRHKYSTARLLLENGADIDRIMENGYTATHIMLIARDYKVVKFLIEEGADVRIADNKGETAYFFMRKKRLQSLLDLVYARDHPEMVAETNAVEAAELP